MSTHHPSRRDADRILDAPVDSDLPVGRALEALRAPGSTHELLREDATVAAFHAARLSAAPRTRSDMSPTTPRTAAVRAVAATGLVVALTSGGFALAATGHLPTLPDQASDRATEAVAQRTAPASETATETAPATATESATVSETPSATTTETATATATQSTSEEATTAPTPSFEGLCTAFQASDKSAHGAALDSAAFTALATAAGGKDAIATYCVGLIGEPKTTGKPTAKPTQAATGKPTAKPTQAATGKPTAKPTQAATSTPTAVPTPTDKGKPADKGKPESPGKR